eukprot:TRINITY_DN4912_c0_g1_i1.p1 TRINITY_DN4912_c0_g1~~TRINITY_DN4912_c0_g1_i1.p1  ORF type:complete len:145 (+),score=23.31 TRINITY_DN4912_c0_g1_i1:43-477(+)
MEESAKESVATNPCESCPHRSSQTENEGADSVEIRYEEGDSCKEKEEQQQSQDQQQQPVKEKPKIPFYGPYTRQLEVGKTYLYCTCGHSKNQPWCDGAHKDTSFKPLKFTVEKPQSRHLLCGCKYTRSPPFCDGVHSALPYGGW